MAAPVETSTPKKSRRRVFQAIGLVVTLLVIVGPVRILWSVWSPSENALALPEGLVALDSKEGQRLLAQSKATADYAGLKSHYVRQERGSFCGVASGVIALNTLGKDGMDQNSFFEGPEQRPKTYWGTLFGGLTLEQLSAMIHAQGAEVKAVHAVEGGYEAFLADARSSLQDDRDIMTVNYDRRVLKQDGYGHHSPIAAYDEEGQTILVMDTAGYKYPPTWVPAAMLWKAMMTIDSGSNKNRGYLLVRLP